MTVNIGGMDKAEVLKALYNRAQPQGLGYLHFTPAPMSDEEAQTIIREYKEYGLFFDYLNGRVMKVHLDDDEFDERLYDRDNGNGAAQNAINTAKVAELTKRLGRAPTIAELQEIGVATALTIVALGGN